MRIFIKQKVIPEFTADLGTKKGEKVELKLINLDPETQKINLSLKHFTPDPWIPRTAIIAR